jgi:hydrogenase maturation protein HypF
MNTPRRVKITLRGAVQGVGFRPFVFRLAREMELTGWVLNTAQGAALEAEGAETALTTFIHRLKTEKPPAAFFSGFECAWLDAAHYPQFEIRPSTGGERTAVVLPDIATCPDCRRELFDPANRRYRYPFINCTHCGPRYSIIEALPYDRSNTTMKAFTQCPACQAEYEDPRDRRFHAQPNACPVCGPQLAWWSANGDALATQVAALEQAVTAIRAGKIVAIKGIGGFQLLADARQEATLRQLRERKHREEKPLAIMCPDLASVRAYAEPSELESQRLQAPEAPIVLLRKRTNAAAPLAPSVAPGNPYLGVMLPYSPLHHLLLNDLGFPVVATSGNLSDEPICINEPEAVARLGGIADFLLVHDRPIARQVDDSVTRVMAGRELLLRRARGYAPLPIELKNAPTAMLAVGAHLKNTVAISMGTQAILSQHIGDLDTPEAFAAFQQSLHSLKILYDFSPREIASDAHPAYRSTQYAQELGLPVFAVQHHYAHICACLADNELEPPVLGVAWDGSGYGLDGTLWGGEFLHVMGESFRRIATWRAFPLPGGETAVREPRRSALGLLYEMFGPAALEMNDLPTLQAFSDTEKKVLRTMLEKAVNSPRTSSVGRLFDAVASLTGGRQQMRHEGQAAMELEFALEGVETTETYPIRLLPAAPEGSPAAATARRPDVLGNPTPAIIIDWEPMIWGIVEDVRHQTASGMVSAKFHNTLAEAIPAVARLADLERVALSGGCFQNRPLLERAIARLNQAGLRPYWHQRVPANDGGIALGQLAAAARRRNVTDKYVFGNSR